MAVSTPVSTQPSSPRGGVTKRQPAFSASRTERARAALAADVSPQTALTAARSVLQADVDASADARLLARRTELAVVVGPVGFNKSEAPNVLEYGGDTVVFRRRGGKLTSQKVKIAPRPYMAPALEKERPKLPLLWRNSIKKG